MDECLVQRVTYNLWRRNRRKVWRSDGRTPQKPNPNLPLGVSSWDSVRVLSASFFLCFWGVLAYEGSSSDVFLPTCVWNVWIKPVCKSLKITTKSLQEIRNLVSLWQKSLRSRTRNLVRIKLHYMSLKEQRSPRHTMTPHVVTCQKNPHVPRSNR